MRWRAESRGLCWAALPATATATHSPDHYSLAACFIIEAILTAFFLLVILGSTDERAPKGFAPIAIGLVPDADPPDLDPGDEHVGEPGAVDGAGAVCRHGWALSQLWLFWVAPIFGAIMRER
jgi:aquaporin Z